MPAYLRRQGDPDGEWCVTDLLRDYRICRYHHEVHGGVHLHQPLRGPAQPVPGEVLSERHAWLGMYHYPDGEPVLRRAVLRRCLTRWRSSSRSD